MVVYWTWSILVYYFLIFGSEHVTGLNGIQGQGATELSFSLLIKRLI